MPFNTPDFQAIRDAILRDILNQPRPDGKRPNVSEDGDYYLRANATGAAIEGLYQHQQWIFRQIFPDRADPDIVEQYHASLRGLVKKSATAATGTITVSGNVGSPIPIGTEAKTDGGITVVTTTTGTIGAGGTAVVNAQASAVGAAGNVAAGTALTLTAAPAGVVSQASIGSMSGGTDIESDASLLSRLLFLLRNPPCGGAAHDYYTWAMNVSGVTAAYVYANRRGLGTTDVIILTSGGLPGSPLIASAQAYIDSQRPVQGDFLVFGPTGIAVNIAAALTLSAGYTLASVSAAINTTLAAYFSTLKPGDTVYLNKLRALISDTPGVVDFNLTSPVGNVVTAVDATHTEMPILGTTAWT